MAFFSQANLEAVGSRDKIRLCPRCGLSLEYIAGRGYCCPRGTDAGGRNRNGSLRRTKKPGAITRAALSPAARVKGGSGRRIEKKNGLVII